MTEGHGCSLTNGRNLGVRSPLHTHTHTHTHNYVYIITYISVCECVTCPSVVFISLLYNIIQTESEWINILYLLLYTYVGRGWRGVEGALKWAPDRRRKGWSEGVRAAGLSSFVPIVKRKTVFPLRTAAGQRAHTHILLRTYKCTFACVCVCVCVPPSPRPPYIILLYESFIHSRPNYGVQKTRRGKIFNIRFRALCVIRRVRRCCRHLSRWPPHSRCIILYTREILRVILRWRNAIYNHWQKPWARRQGVTILTCFPAYYIDDNPSTFYNNIMMVWRYL